MELLRRQYNWSGIGQDLVLFLNKEVLYGMIMENDTYGVEGAQEILARSFVLFVQEENDGASLRRHVRHGVR